MSTITPTISISKVLVKIQGSAVTQHKLAEFKSLAAGHDEIIISGEISHPKFCNLINAMHDLGYTKAKVEHSSVNQYEGRKDLAVNFRVRFFKPSNN